MTATRRQTPMFIRSLRRQQVSKRSVLLETERNQFFGVEREWGTNGEGRKGSRPFRPKVQQTTAVPTCNAGAALRHLCKSPRFQGASAAAASAGAGRSD